MNTLSLKQLADHTGLPIRWLSKQLKKGIPTGAILYHSLRGTQWIVPYSDLENLKRVYRELYDIEHSKSQTHPIVEMGLLYGRIINIPRVKA